MGLARMVGHHAAAAGVAAALVISGFLYLLRVDGGWLALLAYTVLGLIGYRLSSSSKPAGQEL